MAFELGSRVNWRRYDTKLHPGVIIKAYAACEDSPDDYLVEFDVPVWEGYGGYRVGLCFGSELELIEEEE